MEALSVPKEAYIHKGNCALVALSAVSGIPYMRVHEEFMQLEAFDESGVTLQDCTLWLAVHGIEVHWVDSTKYKTLARFLLAANHAKIYLAWTKRHVQALVFGKHVNTNVQRRSNILLLGEVHNSPVKPECSFDLTLEYFLSHTWRGRTVPALAQQLRVNEQVIRREIDRLRRSGSVIVNKGGRYRIFDQEDIRVRAKAAKTLSAKKG